MGISPSTSELDITLLAKRHTRGKQGADHVNQLWMAGVRTRKQGWRVFETCTLWPIIEHAASEAVYPGLVGAAELAALLRARVVMVDTFESSNAWTHLFSFANGAVASVLVAIEALR